VDVPEIPSSFSRNVSTENLTDGKHAQQAARHEQHTKTPLVFV
jgi:hypothetical protein